LPWIGALCLSTFPSIGTTRIVNGRCLRVGVWPNEVMAYVSLNVFDFLLNILNSIIPLIIIDFKLSTQEPLILENIGYYFTVSLPCGFGFILMDGYTCIHSFTMFCSYTMRNSL